MKSGVLLSPSYFFRLSFFISFLCHLFFFSSFILVLSVRPNEEKPNFVFWGAILKEYDIKAMDVMNKGFSPLNFPSMGKGGIKKEQILLPHTSLSKPFFNLTPSETKITLKETFLNNNILEGQGKQMSVDIQSALPSYHPLKLSPND